jgi:hypothetical protein
MFGTLKGRILTIVAVVAASVAFLVINGITLGLDLQGGMYLALEVDDPQGTMTAEARRDATDQALQVINNRIDEFGVLEPDIRKLGDERIIVQLPGIRDEERAKAIIERTAFLEFQHVLPTTELMTALGRIDRAIVSSGKWRRQRRRRTLPAVRPGLRRWTCSSSSSATARRAPAATRAPPGRWPTRIARRPTVPKRPHCPRTSVIARWVRCSWNPARMANSWWRTPTARRSSSTSRCRKCSG